MKLGWLMLSVTVGWAVALGCDNADDPTAGEPNGEAGAPVIRGGEGGTDGGGTEPVRGGGGSGEGGAESCEAGPLECQDCPTLDELRDACARIFRVACGRFLAEPIQQVNPSGRNAYCFDTDGVLVGRVWEPDVPSGRQITGADCGPRSNDLEPVCIGAAGAPP